VAEDSGGLRGGQARIHQPPSIPGDRPLPADAMDGIRERLGGLELRRARPFGNCWLASELWHQLGLTAFWRSRLGKGRESVSWEKVLRLRRSRCYRNGVTLLSQTELPSLNASKTLIKSDRSAGCRPICRRNGSGIHGSNPCGSYKRRIGRLLPVTDRQWSHGLYRL
jgi:hypothetical protein